MSLTLMLGSGANSRSALVRLVVDANSVVELSLEPKVVSAQSSDGRRRISSSVGDGDVVVATAELLAVDDDM